MKILFEDANIVVLEKPAGILSVPYPGFRGKTIFDQLFENRRKRGLIRGKLRPYTVHRLDKDTSGVMMFALTEQAQKKIMDNWQTMVVNRTYRALAETPKNPTLTEEGTINAPLTLNANHHSYVDKKTNTKNTFDNRKNYQDKRKPQKDTKEAITHYKILSQNKRYTMFELELDTGRTNQIRAHLSYSGFPLAGDNLYRAKTDPFNRLCLHARTLSFVHPYTKELLSFEVAEPTSWGDKAK